jgi:hypothetical protein
VVGYGVERLFAAAVFLVEAGDAIVRVCFVTTLRKGDPYLGDPIVFFSLDTFCLRDFLAGGSVGGECTDRAIG